jgi:hypothetical protein
MRCVWMHSRFVKILRQTKYAHGRHEISSCMGPLARDGIDIGVTGERRRTGAYGLTSSLARAMSAVRRYEESSVLVRLRA